MVLKEEVTQRSADVRQLSVCKAEAPAEMQDQSAGLDPEDPDPPRLVPDPPRLKEEQQEARVPEFLLVKREDDQEAPQCSQPRQTDGGRRGKPEPAGNSNTDDKTSDSSDPESDSSDFWTETRRRPSRLKTMKHNELPVRGGPQPGSGTRTSNAVPVSDFLTSSGCGSGCNGEQSLARHRVCPRERNRSRCCSVCAADFPSEKSLERHTAVVHAKRFTCPTCDEIFTRYENLKRHGCVTRQADGVGEDRGGWEADGHLVSDGHYERPSSRLWVESKGVGLKTLKIKVSASEPESEEPCVCSGCGAPLHTASGLLQHSVCPRQCEKRHSCSVCVTCFTSFKHPQRHAAVHRWEKQFSCCTCDQMFTQYKELRKHQFVCGFYPDRRLETGADDKPRGSSEPEPNDCVESRNLQSGLSSLKNSQVAVSNVTRGSGEMAFGCRACGKRLGSRQTLKKHMRIHTGEKPFRCSACGQSFRCDSSLARHMRSHTGVKPFSCSVCFEAFTRLESLTYHVDAHRGEKRDGCGKRKVIASFVKNTATDLSDSLALHKRWVCCSLCGKRFECQKSLKSHLAYHRQEKPFSCYVCRRCFALEEQLTTHMRIHTCETPFRCSFCGKQFQQHSDLGRHLKIHTEKKPYHSSGSSAR